MLSELIAEAAQLGGGNLCASGHDWISVGGRACAHSDDPECSQPVFRCGRCGGYDYGYPGGPGYEECVRHCTSLRARTAAPQEQKEGESR